MTPPERVTLGTKNRLLFLLEYLIEHTDDDHVITTGELLALYQKNGFKCHRTTIPTDISALIDAGVDIITERVPRNETLMNAYHIGNRLFELSELKMLVDAVSSSRFITAEKSLQLIEKLSKLTNEENRSQLTGISHPHWLKTSNKNVFYTMDVIRTSIIKHKKISFNYWDYTPKKEKVLRDDGERYVVSPYSMIWNEDRYYIVAYFEKLKKIIPCRVDCICDIVMTAEDVIENKDFNISDYGRYAIELLDDGMRECSISLLCKNTLMLKVIDRFGEDVKTEIVNDQFFRARVNVVPSSTFYGWVVQFKGEILIESPKRIKREYINFLSNIMLKEKALNT